MARTLSVGDVELVITPTVQRVRVLCHDEPWVVVPRTFAELPEPRQIALLARAVARVALGVPWLEEMPPTHVEAYLIAAARLVSPGYGMDDIDVLVSKTVGQYEPGIAKAIARKQRRLLEEVGSRLALPQARVPTADAFVAALTRAELRTAYLVSGDLLATVSSVRHEDAVLYEATSRSGPRALAATLEHPYAGDVCRFALSAEATALRRRVGSVWT